MTLEEEEDEDEAETEVMANKEDKSEKKGRRRREGESESVDVDGDAGARRRGGSVRWCGDWSGRLKLLRFESRRNRVVLTFSSDYAHGYSGFRARVSARPGESQSS